MDSGPVLSDVPSSDGITLNPGSSSSGGAEEVVFVDALEAGYEFGQYDDTFSGTTSIMQIDSGDPAFGNVVEVKNGTSARVVSWLAANPAKDLSAFADGVLEFDLFVQDAPTDPEATWRMKVECGSDCTSPELTIGGQVQVPPGEWHRVVVAVPSLTIPNMNNITNIVVFNDWTKAAGSTYLIDNVVWKELASAPMTQVFFDEAPAAGYDLALFDNQNTGAVTNMVVDSMDPAHGLVMEINNATSTQTVAWIGNSVAEDMTAFANGSLSFDFYVVAPPTDGTANYLVKIESEPCPAGCTANVEYIFGTQAELEPGVWHSLTIPMADLAVSDITQMRNIVFFNEWTKAAGTIMQIDNIQFNP